MLNFASIFLYRRCGLPLNVHLPEAFNAEKGDTDMDPEKVDCWAFGILMVDMFTGEYLKRKLPTAVKLWAKEIYPIIYGVLRVSEI